MALVGVYVVSANRENKSCHAKHTCVLHARLLGYRNVGANGYRIPLSKDDWHDDCSPCDFCGEWINWADRVEE